MKEISKNFFNICKNTHTTYNELKLLIENKASVNSNVNYSNSPFHEICKNKNNSLDIIMLFIDNKGDVNSKDIYNNTPLYYLVKTNPLLLLFLIKSGFDYSQIRLGSFLRKKCFRDLDLISIHHKFFEKFKDSIEVDNYKDISISSWNKFKLLCVKQFCNIDENEHSRLKKCYQYLDLDLKQKIFTVILCFNKFKKIIPKPLQLQIVVIAFDITGENICISNTIFEHIIEQISIPKIKEMLTESIL